MTERIEIQIPKGVPRTRLEDFLLAKFTGLSKMYLREVIRGEMCEVNGRNENIGFRVRADDLIEIELDMQRENAMRPQKIALDIIYEDNDLIVINKPNGMLVHPTHRERNGTLLNAVTYHVNNGNKGAFIRPGLIHRLDKETSGIVVLAKTAAAHRKIAGQFMKRTIEKKYLALVDGIVSFDEGTIDAPIGRYEETKFWDVKEDGKPSQTNFRVLERHDETTLLELEPVTGRTNQLRIHCQHIGHPIVGDIKRGGREFERLCLHAWKIGFRHPSGGERMEFEAENSLPGINTNREFEDEIIDNGTLLR